MCVHVCASLLPTRHSKLTSSCFGAVPSQSRPSQTSQTSIHHRLTPLHVCCFPTPNPIYLSILCTKKIFLCISIKEDLLVFMVLPPALLSSSDCPSRSVVVIFKAYVCNLCCLLPPEMSVLSVLRLCLLLCFTEYHLTRLMQTN